MSRVKIIGIPPGEAPEWVREEWVGLALPVFEERRPTRGTAAQIISGRPVKAEGYSVPTDLAMVTLKGKSPRAAEWWELTFSDNLPPYLVFPAAVCDILPSLSLLERLLEEHSAFAGEIGDNLVTVIRADRVLEKWLELHGVDPRSAESRNLAFIEPFWGLLANYGIKLTDEAKTELFERHLEDLEELEKIVSIVRSSRQEQDAESASE